MDTTLALQEDVYLYPNNVHHQLNGMGKNVLYQVHAPMVHTSAPMHANLIINVQMAILGTHSFFVVYAHQIQLIQETDVFNAQINKNGVLHLVVRAHKEHLTVELLVNHQTQANVI